ncbi:MAG: M48 family metalloprotease [Alphaproteobacteria bacterium]|nr:M48 family metalloprotease [Alphaproteobacteria bacterium]
MPSVVPYSEKQQILKPEEWEDMRILDQNCPTSQVAAKTMRAIVSRLLKIDKSSKNVDINDFEFLVYDNKSANAGFISADKTQNKKNIILVSTGVTKLCRTEDQLAGVLAHELGHFTYSKIYGKNKNTVFQERFSDLHALDIMIAGGYNPVAYSMVCEQMRASAGGHSLFDVHGSAMARKEDVDAYLTKLHEDMGDFKSSEPTGLYSEFAQVMDSHRDIYRSYLTQVLRKKFPKMTTRAGYLPPLSLFFDTVLSEMKSGRLNNRQRLHDITEYLRKYQPREHEIQSTQHFLEQVVSLYTHDETLKSLLSNYQVVEMAKLLQGWFRGNKPFKVFEPVSQYLEEINKFTTTKDPNVILDIYPTIFEMVRSRTPSIFTIGDMKYVFGKPAGFKMPPRAKAKGQMMPTHWIWETFHETYPGIVRDLDQIGLDCDYEVLTDVQLEGGSIYGGKIIATNKREIAKKIAEHSWQIKYEEGHKHIQDFLFVINLLYDFDAGKISAGELQERFMQYAKQFKETVYKTEMVTWLKDEIILADYNHKNAFLKSDLQELKDSDGFAEIYIKPFLRALAQALHQLYPNLPIKIRFDIPPRGKTWLEYLQEVSSEYLKIKEDVAIRMGKNGRAYLNGKLLDDAKYASRKMGVQYKGYDLFWNVDVGPVVKHISGIYTERLHSILMKFIETAIKEGVYSPKDAADLLHQEHHNLGNKSLDWDGAVKTRKQEEISKIEQETTWKTREDSVERYCVYATREQWAYHNDLTVNGKLVDEVAKKTDLHKVRRLLMAYEMVATNEQELADILSKPIVQYFREQSCVVEPKLKEFCLTYYMRKMPPIKDIYPILTALQKDNSSKFTPNLTDELKVYMDENNLIPQDFHGRYGLYALLENRNFFSHAEPAQLRLMDSLVADVEKMPRQAREEYSWKLLSGFYYSDDDARCYLNRDARSMDLTLAKNKLIEIYASAVAERLGRDDNSDEYFAKIQELAGFIDEKHHCDETRFKDIRVGLDKVTQGRLYRLITDKIQSQERVSQYLANDKNVILSDADAQKNDLIGRRFEEFLEELGRKPQLAVNTIDFLNEKLTTESIFKYCEKCTRDSGDGYIVNFLVASDIENFYHTFWASGLKVRALIMDKLLNRAFDTLDKKIYYVCDMNFDKNDKYRADAEMICDCVIKSFEPYEQNLILAAIASADENKQEGRKASRSVGEGLRMFFETMGPAWVKFGQLLSYVPDLPSEIRRDLGKLKDRADIPARWDVYTWLRKGLPEDLCGRIERVEDVVGAGSFWMTAVVQFRNEDGKTEKKVVQLLRPFADERSDAGFRIIERAIKKLAKQKSSYKMLQSVAHQAHESAKYEVDAEIGYKQYQKAEELYGDISVEVDGTKYTPNVADWRHFGTGKDGMSYKIMDFADGATLSRVKVSDDERRKMALAYFTTEMTVLFKGDVWDIDRHQGQQNFDVKSPTHVDINIYDTGAQLPKAPDKTNKVLLASIFFGLMQAVQKGVAIDSYLLRTIKKLDRLQNDLKIDVSYVSNVEKGLMALSDIIEYQKEIKDPDGNIIQERKTLSADDLKHAIMAVLQNPSIDKYLNVVLRGHAVADKLMRLQLKELKELAESSKHAQEDNPVKISIVDATKTVSFIDRLNKSAEEIKALDNPDDYILGIPKKHIKFNSDKPIIYEPPAKEIA